MQFLSFTLILHAFISLVTGDVGLESLEEFHSYITRPDLKPPKWNITYHDKSRTAPGYWFVAPYNLHDNNLVDVKWQPCQCGPVIYHNDGELVWSGACQFANHVVWNFEQSRYDGDRVLIGVMQHASSIKSDVGTAWILGADYEVKHSIIVPENNNNLDMHEFKTFDNGRRALVALSGEVEYSGAGVDIDNSIRSKDNGLKEIDTATGQTLFEWHCVDHLTARDSTAPIPKSTMKGRKRLWDPFHLNSVDKNEDGDYLVSLRHADLILLVSGQDSSIKWRAGGVSSDFMMTGGLIWSRQHHARFLNSTRHYTTISFVDNASSGKMAVQAPTNPFSRGLIVRLNHPNGKPSTAELLKPYDRPDHELTVKRGSMQILPNSNVFITWSDAGYLTEFAEDGTPLLEARWRNETRFGTYRGYKFDGWVGRPKDRPRLVVITTGVDEVNLSTMYVSWNGATEVAVWEFYEMVGELSVLFGRANRTGFETAFVAQGRPSQIHVKALDANGNVLGESRWVEAQGPQQLTHGTTHLRVNGASSSKWNPFAGEMEGRTTAFPVVLLAMFVGCLALSFILWITITGWRGCVSQ